MHPAKEPDAFRRKLVVRTQTKLLVCMALPLLILLLPSRWIPIETLTTVELRLITILPAALFSLHLRAFA